ncbi:MAG: ABC transporter permease, partial [Phycisphaerales bacterium]
MSSPALTIARTTFIEAVRQPVYFIIVLVAALATLLTVSSTGFAMGYTDTSEVSGDNKLMLDIGMSSIFALGTLLAAFVSTSAISREIENKTILTIVSKPVHRPIVVLGKWLGVTGAVFIAVFTMVIFLLLGVRHGVMSNASQEIDKPVIYFSLAALMLSLGVGVWGNFFYGWNFTQTTTLLLCPLTFVAYVLVLMVGPTWSWQHIFTNMKPQIYTACFVLVLALMVSTSIAVAASARLGQVMTIVVCFALFMLGLVSNAWVGSHAYVNESVAEVRFAEPVDRAFEKLNRYGDQYTITLVAGPSRNLNVGMPFYYGVNANGSDSQVPPFPDTGVQPTAGGEPNYPPGLVVTAVLPNNKLTIQNTSHADFAPKRPPQPRDFIFLKPTRVNPVALGVWGIIPNLQFFW